MKHWKLFLLCVGFASAANAKDPSVNIFPENPWFTGPLISPSGHVTPKGTVNIEPYFTVLDSYGDYDKHWKLVKDDHSLISNIVNIYTTIGLTKWMDFAITPTVLYNVCQGKQAFFFSNLEAGFDFQLLTDTQENNLPGLKLGIRQSFPIGKYDHLNPNMHEVDIGSDGTYKTLVLLCASRLFHLRGDVWLNPRFSVGGHICTRVHVKGYNIYGGAADTDGYAYPPPQLWFDLSFELSLSRHWALACDLVNGYDAKRKFKGNPGTDSTGAAVRMTKGSSATVWLAPAVEYNWNDNIGIITGAWFTITGRLSEAFASWQSGFNYVF
ncbi:MAG: hypothetical protein HW387_1501 [Parachlamydiales bacterium]|nr:hypothetical protein [Parachlamydiales bacterium]